MHLMKKLKVCREVGATLKFNTEAYFLYLHLCYFIILTTSQLLLFNVENKEMSKDVILTANVQR